MGEASTASSAAANVAEALERDRVDESLAAGEG
jgi:hypothetical protein